MATIMIVAISDFDKWKDGGSITGKARDLTPSSEAYNEINLLSGYFI
jgi:hypothetical protein